MAKAKEKSFNLAGLPKGVSQITASEFQHLINGGNMGNLKVELPPTPKKLQGSRVKEYNVELTRGKSFWIPGNVPSKKRAYEISQKRVRKFDETTGKFKSTKFTSLRKGDHIVAYEKNTAPYYSNYAEEFRIASAGMKPVWVEFKFLRSTKRAKWDFSNMHAIVTDLMTQYSWIDDDAIDCILPLPPLIGETWIVDSQNPGVIVTIVKLNVKLMNGSF